MEVQEVKDTIQNVLQNQKYGVYNTVRNEQPHSALVGFAATPDLSKIIILTNRNTRKYINTQLHHKVTLFISTTTNDPKDLDEAIAVSIIGSAEVGEKLKSETIAEYRSYFLEKNAYMKDLAEAISDIIVITVDTFELTKSFQKSVVQTSTDMSTLHVRQLPGEPVVKGFARGKVVLVKSTPDLNKDFGNSVVVINSTPSAASLTNFKAKALVIGETTIKSEIEKTLKENNIPTVKGVSESINELTDGKDITVNGSLGVIIFHELKS